MAAGSVVAASPWNSLEIVKLIVEGMTPILLMGIGFYVQKITRSYESRQWNSQKLIEKRLEIYDSMAPNMNDILCYFSYVGSWRDMDPPDIIALKRGIDKKLYLAAPLFSGEFLSACQAFQVACFETYNGWGKDALLRTKFERRMEARDGSWNSEWAQCFSPNVSEPREVTEAYKRVMAVFSEEIGVCPMACDLVPGVTPIDIR